MDPMSEETRFAAGPGLLPHSQGRATEPVLRAYGISYAVAEPDLPIGAQVERAATFAEEGSAPFVLLLDGEDIRW